MLGTDQISGELRTTEEYDKSIEEVEKQIEALKGTLPKLQMQRDIQEKKDFHVLNIVLVQAQMAKKPPHVWLEDVLERQEQKRTDMLRDGVKEGWLVSK